MEHGERTVQIQNFEKSVSHIGAKVAYAIELSQKTRQLFMDSEALLINVQRELEELYVLMGGSDFTDEQETEAHGISQKSAQKSEKR